MHNPFYHDPLSQFSEDEELYTHGIIKKKRILSTQYSFKTDMTPINYEIDQFLILDHKSMNDQQKNEQKKIQKKEIIKMRNRINAQKSRLKKKNEFQSIAQKVKQLQIQNKILKQNNTYCRKCKAKINQYNPTKQITNIKLFQINQKNKDLQIQFQNPQFYDQQKSIKNGKIWIAIAIIMLIIGINVHGINHEQFQVKMKKSTVYNFGEQLKNKQSSVKIPLQFQQKSKINKNDNEKKQKYIDIRLQNFRIEGVQEDQVLEQEVYQINKEFISELQAHISDLSQYM